MSLPPADQAALPAIWLLLGCSRLAVLMVGFRHLSAILGANLGPHAYVPLLTTRQEERAARLGRLVHLVARYTPWQSNCFPQALTARLLMGFSRLPCAIYFGVASEPCSQGQLTAHAWTASGRVFITGGNGFAHYTVVACFVSA